MNENFTRFVLGLGIIGIFLAVVVNKAEESLRLKIDKTCQGTPWVIEEPLIKKTLTCVVEVKK